MSLVAEKLRLLHINRLIDSPHVSVEAVKSRITEAFARRDASNWMHFMKG